MGLVLLLCSLEWRPPGVRLGDHLYPVLSRCHLRRGAVLAAEGDREVQVVPLRRVLLHRAVAIVQAAAGLDQLGWDQLDRQRLSGVAGLMVNLSVRGLGRTRRNAATSIF